MGGKESLQDHVHWQDHHDILVHLVHQDDLLANLLQDVAQHEISACASFILAVLVRAVGLHAVVYLPTVQAGPGIVGQVIRVVGEVGGDGGDDAALWAGV